MRGPPVDQGDAESWNRPVKFAEFYGCQSNLSLKRDEKRRSLTTMRERDREINRRRHRYQKRKKLRLKLAAAGAEAEQQKIEAKIRKTYPTFTPI
jgi:hypothetical protein